MADVQVCPLTPERCGDFLRFFDHEQGRAFADNPAWAKCYCHYYHVPLAIDWNALDGVANRTAMRARIDTAEMEGFLAYAGEEVVGWLNAQPLHKLRHCWARMGLVEPPLDAPLHELAAIVCFVIAPEWRRRGIARNLLAAALDNLADRGLRRVYAFPFKTGEDSRAAAHYHGPEALFRESGFLPVSATAELTVVTKDLAASGPRGEPG